MLISDAHSERYDGERVGPGYYDGFIMSFNHAKHFKLTRHILNNITLSQLQTCSDQERRCPVESLLFCPISQLLSIMHSDSESGSLRVSLMFEQTCITGCFNRGLNVARLHDLKYRALRSGLWFKALRRIDRVLVDLTVRVSKSVHSATLARALYSVIEKLKSAFKNRVWSAVHKVGFPLAHKLSMLAQKWGNYDAQNWAFDESFAKYLAIMHINSVGPSEI